MAKQKNDEFIVIYYHKLIKDPYHYWRLGIPNETVLNIYSLVQN